MEAHDSGYVQGQKGGRGQRYPIDLRKMGSFKFVWIVDLYVVHLRERLLNIIFESFTADVYDLHQRLCMSILFLFELIYLWSVINLLF